jgi:hypothetical protein
MELITGAELAVSPMVHEGGGIHVDGLGTVLVTETGAARPGAEPGWTTGVRLVHVHNEAMHPDYAISREILDVVRDTRDVTGHERTRAVR